MSSTGLHRGGEIKAVSHKGDAASGVSWPAVIGGAFVAAALSLILLTLGTGLGLSGASPWSTVAATASSLGTGAIVWLIVTQVIASAMGGYLAGRLRTKWTTIHTDEVYFRDTAHGFLVWAVGLVITAGFLASAAASFAGQAKRIPSDTSGAPSQEILLDPNAYFVDMLLRSSGSVQPRPDGAARGEVARTFAHDLHAGAMSTEDQTYLAQIVSNQTGVSSADADKRVSAVFSDAQETTDRARKALAHFSLWLFVALLFGAFSASYAGTIGGRQRDHVLVHD